MPWRRLTVLVSSLALGVGLLAPPTLAADPLEINAILALSGPGAFLGKNEQIGLQLVESKVNKTGGIAGRPVKFIFQDDQSSPQVAVQLTNALIAKKVPLIFGSTLVGSCNAMAPLAKDGPVIYCFSAGMHPEKGSYVFTYGIATDDLIATNLRYFRLRGLKKIAILASTDASGQDGERAIDAGLAAPDNKEMTVVAREHYGVSDLSVVAQLSRIKDSGAQALIAWGTGTPIGTVFRGLNDVGLSIPVGISASNLTYAQMKQFASIVPAGMVSASPPSGTVPEAIPNGPLRNAVRTYIDAFKAIGVQADISQAISWDPGLIVVDALKKLGPNATAGQLKEYLSNLRGWAGANGVYDFRSGNQRGLGGIGAGIMVRWDPAKDAFVGISKFGGDPL